MNKQTILFILSTILLLILTTKIEKKVNSEYQVMVGEPVQVINR